MDVSVIPDTVFRSKFKAKLEESDKRLKGPNQQSLSVRGRFSCSLRKGSQLVQKTVYVVHGLGQPLLGQPTIKALNIEVVREVGAQQEFFTKYPRLLSGLERMKQEYHIQLKDRYEPYALSSPR